MKIKNCFHMFLCILAQNMIVKSQKNTRIPIYQNWKITDYFIFVNHRTVSIKQNLYFLSLNQNECFSKLLPKHCKKVIHMHLLHVFLPKSKFLRNTMGEMTWKMLKKKGPKSSNFGQLFLVHAKREMK